MGNRGGRPPKPVEQKRRAGNPGKRPLPKSGQVVALRAAPGVPDPSGDLLLDGVKLWNRAWDQAITWLSPISDWEAVEAACRLADDVAKARARYRATTDPADARALVALSKEWSSALSALGFTPTDRTRLGVAEVKKQSALEELIARRQSK